MDQSYRLKHIRFFAKPLSIILQSKNGPCPLLAIANALILKGHLTMHEDLGGISHADVTNLVADYVFRTTGKAILRVDDNEKRKVDDVIGIIPKLHYGLDVNVKFTNTTDFEYTPELDVFDVMNLRLVHGWVITRESEVASAVGSRSYNQLQEALINYHIAKEKDPADPDLAGGELVAHFLEETASQLTHEGLARLHEQLEERAVVVFFRNNHFSTIVKYQGCIFLLATDEGFANQPRIVWEKLNEVSGNTIYCNSNFEEIQLSEDVDQSRQNDYEAALQLQELEHKAKQEEDDLELARKMQTELNIEALRPANARPPINPSQARRQPAQEASYNSSKKGEAPPSAPQRQGEQPGLGKQPSDNQRNTEARKSASKDKKRNKSGSCVMM